MQQLYHRCRGISNPFDFLRGKIKGSGFHFVKQGSAEGAAQEGTVSEYFRTCTVV